MPAAGTRPNIHFDLMETILTLGIMSMALDHRGCTARTVQTPAKAVQPR